MVKFYFAGTIRGGRDKVETFIKISDLLKKYGIVLDEHVANPNVTMMEQNVSLEEIYTRDINWIGECDYVVAEVSTPSLGVGYELAYAESINKPIICLYDENINVSAMIRGNKYFNLIKYKNDDELLSELDQTLNEMINVKRRSLV